MTLNEGNTLIDEINSYENVRRVQYGTATFVPVCEKCGRFVKADEFISLDYQEQPRGKNATCKKCGRTKMLFKGHF